MKKTKHTPGPWKIIQYDLDHRGAGWIQIGTDEHNWMAEVKGTHVFNGSIEEIEANARLIVAAPELLEALQNMIRLFDRDLPENSMGRTACDEAILAINKALS